MRGTLLLAALSAALIMMRMGEIAAKHAERIKEDKRGTPR